jgi:RHS repeat-associated protein
MKRLALGLSLAALAIAAGAQQGPDNDPAAAQGYVKNSFHHTDFDSINSFNGQLTIPVPIGPAFQIGPRLTFQAMLAYGLRLTEPGHPTNELENNPNYYPVVGDPALGVGWNFTPGKIACGALPTSPPLGTNPRPVCYLRPDGAEIDFFGAGPTYATTDATQYKLVHNGASPSDSYTMYDGDGNVYDFAWRVSGYDDVPYISPGYARDYGRSRDGYYLTSITDPFGNKLTVAYQADGVTACPLTCSLPTGMRCVGTTMRSWIPGTFSIQRVGEASQQIGAVVFDPSARRIRAVRLKTLVGGTGQFSEWSLQYGIIPINRATIYCSPTVLPTLTGIAFPSDIAGSPSYSFDYFPSVNIAQGLLKSMTLPTGARVYYDYGNYHFYRGRLATFSGSDGCSLQQPPAGQTVRRSQVFTDSGAPGDAAADVNQPFVLNDGPCLPGTASRQYQQSQVGVLRRTVAGPDIPTAVTEYTQYSFPYGENATTTYTSAQTLTVALMPADKDGNRRGEATLFWAGNGLVDSQNPSQPGDRVGADLRHAVYARDPNPPVTVLVTTPVCGSAADSLCPDNAVRVTQHVFEYNLGDTSDGLNRRIKSLVTYHGPITNPDPLALDYCPSCPKHSIVYSLSSGDTWEGNGRHYNIETHAGNLGSDARTVTTDWAPSMGPNLLNLYARRTETELEIPPPTQPASRRNAIDHYFDFDPATGFLKADWVWDPPTSRYLAHCRYGDSQGNVRDDLSAAVVAVAQPASDPCPGSLSGWPTAVIGLNDDAFGQEMTYAGGLRATNAWLKDKTPLSQGAGGWFAQNLTRDSATGWVRDSSDTAGKKTSFFYDSLGRATVIMPPDGEAPTVVVYESPTRTSVSRSGGGDSTQQVYLYDSLGRLVREIRQMPTGYSVRTHEFDAPGHEIAVSEWASCTSTAAPSGSCLTAAPSGTLQSNFDPIGRPQTIRRADGSTTTFDFTDGAVTFSETAKKAAIGNVGGSCSGGVCSGGVSAATTFRYDAFGRLRSVTEPAAPSADTTSYTYDAGNRLFSVTQGSQTRIFAYDAFGFLIQESTPEAGTVTYTAVAGGRTYSNWGSIGNLRGKAEPDGTVLTYTYDPAGRLKTLTAGGANLLTNCYDGETVSPCSFAVAGANGGKLSQRIGLNTGVASTVTENFTYSGLGGRLSQKDVTISGTPKSSLTFTESWSYNLLGLPASHTHPKGATDPAVTGGLTYVSGVATGLSSGVQTVVSSASYDPSAGLSSWKAGNNVVTTISQDASLVPRPARIFASLGGFDTGPYTYDGAGNITFIGSDQFAYDARSRLVSATLAGQSSQGYSYDRFGNVNPAGVSAATNRLSAGIYDARGNLLSLSGQTHAYDALSRQTSAGTERYVYDGAGERIAKVTGGDSYFTLAPCRFFDTRRPSGPTGGPILGINEARPVPIVGNPACGGVPSNATAVSGNLTVTGITAPGSLALSPGGSVTALGTLNYDATAGVLNDRANNFVLGLSSDGKLLLTNSSAAPVHGLVDVTGYFTSSLESWSLTLRDESNRLSAEYRVTPAAITRTKDYFYFGNLLVATLDSGGNYFYYSSDHLGTPRLVTNSAGLVVESHKYFPYGAEVSGGFGNHPLKFALMERDSSTGNDYDHARFSATPQGRFMSPDKLGGRPATPSTWNRYTYTLSNPVKHIDPDGRLTIVVHGTWASGSQTFQPGGRFFDRVAGTVHDRAVASFSWSGGNSSLDRREAARSLASFIRSYRFAPGEQLNVVAHSHGGNVAIAAINLGFGRTVDNLVTLGTPVRPEYRLADSKSVANFVAVSNARDPVQANGGNSLTLPVIGEVGAAGRVQLGATNIYWGDEVAPWDTHAALHEDASAWTVALDHMNLPAEDQFGLNRRLLLVHE